MNGINGNYRDNMKIAKLMAQAEEMAVGANVAQTVQTVAPIVSSTNNVSVTGVNTKTDTVGTVNVTGNPVIDQPADDATTMQEMGALYADLERLISELTLDSEEKQATNAQQRIKQMLGQIKSAHENVLKKLSASLQQSEEIAKALQAAKILSWIMTALTCVLAAVTAVATFGAGTGGALAMIGAGLAIAGAAVSLIQQSLNESGVLDKEIEKKAEKLKAENPEKSWTECREEASDQINNIFMGISIAIGVLSIACAVSNIVVGLKAAAGEAVAAAAEEATAEAMKEAAQAASQATQELGKGVAETLKAFFKTLAENVGKLAKSAKEALNSALAKQIMKWISRLGGIVQTGLSVSNTVLNYTTAKDNEKVEKLKAQIKELQALLERLESSEEQEEEDLKAILLTMEDTFDKVATVLSASSETNSNILDNIRIVGA